MVKLRLKIRPQVLVKNDLFKEIKVIRAYGPICSPHANRKVLAALQAVFLNRIKLTVACVHSSRSGNSCWRSIEKETYVFSA